MCLWVVRSSVPASSPRPRKRLRVENKPQTGLRASDWRIAQLQTGHHWFASLSSSSSSCATAGRRKKGDSNASTDGDTVCYVRAQECGAELSEAEAATAKKPRAWPRRASSLPRFSERGQGPRKKAKRARASQSCADCRAREAVLPPGLCCQGPSC